MERKHIWFTGQVQGVGFRWTASQLAEKMHLSGWCRNDMDGRVEMEIQGEASMISRFLKELGSFGSIRIDHMDMHSIPVVSNETGFEVKFWW
ncbi:MAG: acylphosphatase [Absicoccus sp.]|uniref:acylphosphatase n=1 Tax=Absicoccus intestinalis TaxID=2926319 RepID=A0ABU4WN28_9FIRM|nr:MULTISPECIES: acylphosphatase [unclassified Absicoccus]MDX8417965.1 acylphosphatase [Absicoccus sp. CLA-KB-P134]MDY3035960.1 acylphosphatase [Absicoccus sp.]